MQSRISELTNEVEDLRNKLNEIDDGEKADVLHRAFEVLEDDRDKLMKTIEPLMKTNKELRESLDTLAKEIEKKNNEIRKLRQTTIKERKEIELVEKVKANEMDEVQKQSEKEMKEIKMKHKKVVTKVRCGVFWSSNGKWF